MYEIFIANRALVFCETKELEGLPGKRFGKVVPYSYDLNLVGLLKVMASGPDHADVAITHELPAIPYARTVSQMAWEEAAGGVVLTPDRKQILVIHRRGYWDLPKGKPLKNESTPESALREVREETGLKNVSIVKPIGSTSHVFVKSEIHVLKKTMWFEMVSGDRDVKPQRSEDIDEVLWIDCSDLPQYLPKMYRSLQALVGRYLPAPP